MEKEDLYIFVITPIISIIGLILICYFTYGMNYGIKALTIILWLIIIILTGLLIQKKSEKVEELWRKQSG